MKKLMRINRANRARTLASASGRAAGFTLVEMLVAVGAVAFVAVGIASIFASVGDTVSRGRSVSAITQYAAVLERQMREDFSAMTRDGYLIIRHEYADDGMPVPLYADQPLSEWRRRRIDELMFFIDEPTASAREPLVPGFVPEGSSARIYYGIGQRMEEDVDPASAYAQPDVTTVNRLPDTASGHLPGSPTPGNPNRFAGQWTLVRQSTALVSIGGGITDAPFASGPYSNPLVWRDNRLQVGLQPAAESIFRSINALDYGSCPILFPQVQTVRGQAGVSDPDLSPRFESGLVDVATTNLEEIRGIVQSSAGLLADPSGSPVQYAYLSPAQLINCSLYVGPGRIVGPVGVQQAWMLDGMPAPSHPTQLDFDPSQFADPGMELTYRSVNRSPDQIARMRFEPAPPDIHSSMFDLTTSARATEGAIRLADQYALASSGFIPRVSDFIVEWSFGKTDDDGQIIWHGAERGIDYDDDTVDDLTVLPYPRYDKPVRGTPADLAGSYFVPYRLQRPAPMGVAGVGDTPREFTSLPRLGDVISMSLSGDFADVGDVYASYPVLPEVVQGVRTSTLGGAGTNSVVSYFGYTLPFFSASDPDGDGNLADAAAEETLEWPWPELVRVTVTLTDPGDETIERTFQFIFPTPDNTAR